MRTMTIAEFKKTKNKTVRLASPITSRRRKKKLFDIRGECQDMAFLNNCAIWGIPKPEAEFHFHNSRQWRMDFAWPEYKVFVEKEGGIYERNGGGHRSIKGYLSNKAKYNAAGELGWILLRYLPDEMNSKQSLDQIRNTLRLSGCVIK